MAVAAPTIVAGTALATSSTAVLNTSARTVGEYGLVMISRAAVVAPTGVPTGWTLLQSHLSTYGIWLYGKILTSDDKISNLTWPWAASSKTMIRGAFYGGVDGTTPVATSVKGTYGTASAQTLNLGTVTTNETTIAVLASCYAIAAKTYSVLTSTLTERYDSGSTAPDFWHYIGDTNATWGGGAFTPSTVTNYISAAATYRGGFIVVLNAKAVATGTGSLDAGPATMEGTGKLRNTGTGTLDAGAATVTGTGKVTIKGTGSLEVGASTLTGSGTVPPPGVSGTGSLTAGAASMEGTGKLRNAGTGSLSAGAASLIGTNGVTRDGLAAEYVARLANKAQTVTLYSSGADGLVEAYGTNYSSVRAGTASVTRIANDAARYAGQTISGGTTYYLGLLYFDFDTSAIPDNAVVTSVEFSLYCSSAAQNTVAHIQELYQKDWGATLDVADFVPGDDVSSLTQVAGLDTTGLTTGYKTFANESAMSSAIVKNGTTRFMLCSSRFRTGDVPTGTERVQWYLNEQGEGYRPRLVVTYEASPGNNTDPTSTWDDTVGDNDLSLKNFAYTTSSGWRGNGSGSDPYALVIDPTNDYADVAAAVIDADRAWSIEGWVRCPNKTAQRTWVSGCAAATVSAQFQLKAEATTGYASYAIWRDSGGAIFNSVSTVDICDDAWHHVVITYNGATSKMYVDGSAAGTDRNWTDAVTTGHFAVGGFIWNYGANVDTNWNGPISTVRAYNRALSAAEVLANYKVGAASVGTGSLTAGAATVSGEGSVTGGGGVSGTGSLTMATATLTGTGRLLLKGTGSLERGAATVTGDGKLRHSGTGELNRAAAQASGSGRLRHSGTGSLTHGAATLQGTGKLRNTGSGALARASATLSGSGRLVLKGTGELQRAAAAISGTGVTIIKGTGALERASATITGSGNAAEDVTGTGALTAGAASVDGTGNAPVPGVDYIGSWQNSWANIQSGSFQLPSGWQEGDLALLFFYCRSDTKTMTVPTGWTSLRNNGEALYGRVQVMYRVLEATNTLSIAATSVPDQPSGIIVSVWRDVNLLTQFTTVSDMAASPPDPPTVTVPTSGAAVIGMGGQRGLVASPSPPTDTSLCGNWSFSGTNDASGMQAYLITPYPNTAWDLGAFTTGLTNNSRALTVVLHPNVSNIEPGVLRTGPSTASGSGKLRNTGTGSLQRAAAQAGGSGKLRNVGTGSLQRSSASVGGTALLSVIGTGSLQRAAAQVSGSGYEVSTVMRHHTRLVIQSSREVNRVGSPVQHETCGLVNILESPVRHEGGAVHASDFDQHS